MRTVTVFAVHIEPMSTIGCGKGYDEEGNVIAFLGDHRAMRHIGEAIQAALSVDDLPVVTDLESWQVIAMSRERLA